MHLIRPNDMLCEGLTRLDDLEATAQQFSDGLARQMGISTPRVNITPWIIQYADWIGESRCQSPMCEYAQLTRTGELLVTIGEWDTQLIKFAIAHQFAHLLGYRCEWECDLAALDALGCPDTLVIKNTALIIARETPLRKRAFRFKAGERIILFADHMGSGIWSSSFG